VAGARRARHPRIIPFDSFEKPAAGRRIRDVAFLLQWYVNAMIRYYFTIFFWTKALPFA
jgi:hypothetical protein